MAPFLGHIDEVTPEQISGWCVKIADGKICKVDILIDQKRVATVAGVDFREDLAPALHNAGLAGFSLPMPLNYLDGRTHHLVARFHGTETDLNGSPVTFSFPPELSESGDWVGAYRSLFSDQPLTIAAMAALPERYAASGRRRIAIYCGFSDDIQPLSLSNPLIAALQRQGYFVLHIHATARAQESLEIAPRSVADTFLVKHNIGYDFGSWLSGAALLDGLRDEIDEVLLVNDSNFGPIFPLDKFLSDAAMGEADVFGLLDSYEISYHVQSYMVRLSAQALRAGLLDRLAQNYPITMSKARIVSAGEIGLTRLAHDLGLKVRTQISYEEVRDRWLENCDRYRKEARDSARNTKNSMSRSQVDRSFGEIEEMARLGMYVDPAHFWRTLYEEMQFPVLKRDLVLKNSVRVPDWHLMDPILERLPDYPTETIRALRQDRTKETESAAPTRSDPKADDQITVLYQTTRQARYLHRLRKLMHFAIPGFQELLRIRDIRRHNVLDRDYYLAAYPGLHPLFRLLPERHYVLFGEALGYQPAPTTFQEESSKPVLELPELRLSESGDWVGAYRSLFSDQPLTIAAMAALPERYAASGRRRIAIYCGFSDDIQPLSLSNPLIAALQRQGYFVLHIHATARAQESLEIAPRSVADTFLVKHNIGYDFGSWLSGAALLDGLRDEIDEVLLVNDSNFGPIFPLDKFLSDAAMGEADVFGLLDSYEISYHVQSYMVRLSAQALRAGLLDRLAQNYPITMSKARIVSAGEIGLTRLAHDLGLKVRTQISYEEVRDRWLENCDRYRKEAVQALGKAVSPWFREKTDWRFLEVAEMARSGKSINPTHYFWRTLYEEMQFPVLKRDLMLKNPVRVPDWHLIGPTLAQLSDYSAEMIRTTSQETHGLIPFFRDLSQAKITVRAKDE